MIWLLIPIITTTNSTNTITVLPLLLLTIIYIYIYMFYCSHCGFGGLPAYAPNLACNLAGNEHAFWMDMGRHVGLWCVGLRALQEIGETAFPPFFNYTMGGDIAGFLMIHQLTCTIISCTSIECTVRGGNGWVTPMVFLVLLYIVLANGILFTCNMFMCYV